MLGALRVKHCKWAFKNLALKQEIKYSLYQNLIKSSGAVFSGFFFFFVRITEPTLVSWKMEVKQTAAL